jgi:hypothetical protein
MDNLIADVIGDAALVLIVSASPCATATEPQC